MTRSQQAQQVRVVVASYSRPSEAIAAADQIVQGLSYLLRKCEFFVHSPSFQAEIALSAMMARLNVQSRVPILVRTEQGLLGENPRIWEWVGRPDQCSVFAIYGLRPGLVRAEGRAVLKTIESLAKEAREAGKDSVLAVSHPWPVAAAVMIARRKLGEEKPPIVDWTASAVVLFTFKDDKLVEVAIRAPGDGGLVQIKAFRDPVQEPEDRSYGADWQ